MSPNASQRDDYGFSFVQMIVTMVIGGILLTTVGFAAFQYIQTARETVLESNIRTAAEAVQNTLALNPNLRTTGNPADTTLEGPGAASPALLSELTNAAGFAWTTTDTAAAGNTGGWVFADTDTPNIVHIQMIQKATGATSADQIAATKVAVAGDGTTVPVAPVVRWLVDDRDAVRLQIRNEDGSWACALIVLRPDWNTTMAGGTPTEADQATVEGNLRGIWFDAGANIPADNGLHHCSPISNGALRAFAGTTALGGFATPDSFGNAAAKDGPGTDSRDPLPVNGSTWNIPGDGAVPNRTLLQSVPDFESS